MPNYSNTSYDIGKAFAAIEDELMASMIRNLKRHKLEEINEDKQWSMWQTEQLKSLERYKIENQKKYGKQFASLNSQIAQLLKIARQEGGMTQEISILNAIKNGFTGTNRMSEGATAKFFKLNNRKLNALIRATTHDMQKAETAVLRMANDQYRQVIYNAQVYANTGAGTYEKAVDMATKDFLSRGINCVQYKNGARHTIADYADMAIRTASKRAYLQGEGEKRQEWGISTVIMNKRGNPCPLCLPFVGKVFIDDVWSGGKKSDGDYPLLSGAIAKGLYHPRCKDSHTTYFPGISTPPEAKYTKEELKQIELEEQVEARQQYAKRQVNRFHRLGKNSLDLQNTAKYCEKEDSWEQILKGVHMKTGGMTSDEFKKSKILPGYSLKPLPSSQVVNTLAKDAKRWVSSLTSAEKKVIKDYTGDIHEHRPKFYERLNAMLRKEIPEDANLRKKADILSSAILKNQLKHDIIVFRNTDKDYHPSLKSGQIFTEDSFLSTSLIEEGTIKGNYKITIWVKKGTQCSYVESLSNFPEQKELLLNKGLNYKVISKNDKEMILEVM